MQNEAFPPAAVLFEENLTKKTADKAGSFRIKKADSVPEATLSSRAAPSIP